MCFVEISPFQDSVSTLDKRMMTLESNMSADFLSIEGQVRRNNDKLEDLDAILASTKHAVFQNQLNLSSLLVSVYWSTTSYHLFEQEFFSAECLFVEERSGCHHINSRHA